MVQALNDFAVGSDVMCVLIAFVSSAYFQVPAVDIEGVLGGGRFTANLASSSASISFIA